MRCVRFKTNLGIARVRYCVHMSGFSVRHRGWGWVVVVEGSSWGGGGGGGIAQSACFVSVTVFYGS